MATFTLTQAVPHAEKYYVYPNGDVSGCSQWTPIPTDPDYLCIDEDKNATNFDDYIYWDISAVGTEIFGFENFSPPAGTVNYVKLHGWARCYPDSVAASEEFYLVVSPTSACDNIHKSDTKNLVTGWKKFDYSWIENPDTVAVWSVAEINGSAFGVEGKGKDLDAEFAFAEDDGGYYRGVNCYNISGGDIYTAIAAGSDLYLYGMSSNGNMTLLDTANDSPSNTYDDVFIGEYNSKIYVFVSMGVDGLAVYEIAGVNLVLKDTIDNGDFYRGIWYDENQENIWVARSGTGISVYSFDGTNLVLEDTQDDGFYYDVHGTTPYVFAAMGLGGLKVYRFSGGNITLGDAIDDGGTYYGVWSNGITPWGVTGTTVHCACDGDCNAYQYNANTDTLTNLDDYGTGGDYEHVWGNGNYVFYSCKNEGLRIFNFDGSDYIYVQTITDFSVCDGVGFNSEDDVLVISGQLEGERTYTAGVTQQLYLASTYLEIDYTSDTTICTLNRPQQISTNHARNIKMLNFWNGDREVYDLNRSGKSMVLTGIENGASACDTILCVRNMARNGAAVTVGTLSPTYFNGNYRIRQFGWNKISEKSEHYHWILSLEQAD